MEGAIDQPIRINEEEAFRLHDRSVAQEERGAGETLARSSARGRLGVATAAGTLDQKETEEKPCAADNREPREFPVFAIGFCRLKGVSHLLICARPHCGSLRRCRSRCWY